jgi:REP element-mobilizing transposase RayT
VDRVDDLREVVRAVRQMHPFEIVAWVLLPERLHATQRNQEKSGTRRNQGQTTFSLILVQKTWSVPVFSSPADPLVLLGKHSAPFE